MNSISISKITARHFVIGKQGLWPGRRFAGAKGAIQALKTAEALQLDPLNVVARSQDIAMWGRVLDYQPEFLYQAAYEQREFFDYGGGLFMYPMSELPYWRPVMARALDHPRWGGFSREHPQVIAQVLDALHERGPLGNRDFDGNKRVNSYRGRKDTALALYALWLSGEVMIHHRKGFDRYYDLRERIVPPAHSHIASEEEAHRHFSRKAVGFLGLLREKRWSASVSGYLDRKLDPQTVQEYLSALYEQDIYTRIKVEGSKEVWLVLSEDLPLLAALEAGQIPQSWAALGPTSQDEVIFLAPLEIVSARGRAKEVFDFEYLWEVYKPLELRRWGYYTLPILYGDDLVARIDPKLDRKTGTLQVNGFWLEDEASAKDPAFADALGKGLARFASFVKASQVELGALQPGKLRNHIQKLIL
ncbi:MAG TPA: crosslink repair DNA glycosylase YcaQ family protein [Anaerolineales bacterium]|jgi:hypothetical protein